MKYATHVRSALTPLIIASSIAFALGCGSKDDNGGTGPTPAIAIAINPTSATIPQGGSAPVTVTITRSGGFTGTVNLAVTGNPTGVTGAISNVQTAGGVTTATVTVQVAASVAVGTYNLTLTGSGSGVTDKTATFALTVGAAPAYTLSLSSATMSAAQGGNNTATVTLTRTNFTGAVTLSLVGAPANVTGTFDPAAPTGTTSTLTVTVGAAVPTGTYNLQVHGEGAGATVAGQDTPLTLTVTPPVVGNFTLAVAPAAASVAQGVNPTSPTISINRTGGFTGSVALTVTGAPTGVTATATPASTSTNSATLDITVAGTTAVGVYPLVVHGNATGLAEQTATYTLTVTAAATADFTLSLTPASASVNQGVNPTSPTININRTGGFTGSVALTVTGAPTGVTASATPASTTTNSSTLNITVAGTTAVGVYPLVVHGNATGLAEQTVTYTLTVTAPASGSITLNFAPCLNPIWVAVQDNNGPWTHLTLTNGSVTANVNGPKIGLAYVTGSTAAAQINIIYLAASDISGNTQNFCGTTPPPGTNTMNGTATGFAANDAAFISMGGGSSFSLGTPPAFQIPNVANGTQDLFAYRRNQVSTAASPDKLIIRRDIAVTNGGSVGAVLDFNGSEAVSPASANITVVGAVSGGPLTSAMFYRSGAACYSSTFYVAQETGTTFPVFGVPSGSQRAAEGHNLLLSSLDPLDNTNQESYIDFFHTMAAHTVTFGGLLPAPTVTEASGPYKRLQAAFTLPAAYNLLAGFSYAEGSTAHSVSINATAAYLGGTSVTLTMPDFSALSGWDNGYAPALGSSGITTVIGSGGSATLFLGCASDGFLKTASRQGTY